MRMTSPGRSSRERGSGEPPWTWAHASPGPIHPRATAAKRAAGRKRLEARRERGIGRINDGTNGAALVDGIKSRFWIPKVEVSQRQAPRPLNFLKGGPGAGDAQVRQGNEGAAPETRIPVANEGPVEARPTQRFRNPRTNGEGPFPSLLARFPPPTLLFPNTLDPERRSPPTEASTFPGPAQLFEASMIPAPLNSSRHATSRPWSVLRGIHHPGLPQVFREAA